MKQIIFALSGIVLALAGCQSTSSEEYTDEFETAECVGEECSVIKYATPNGNDLVLETDRHIIEIAAQPGTQYSYYVWAGDKDMSDDPDMIVQDGNAMILTQE